MRNPTRNTDESWTLVPPGEYTVGFLAEEKFSFFSRLCWVVTMQIVDSGEFAEVRLPFYLNAIPKGKSPTPGWSVCSAFLVATERRPPKDLWRLRPRTYLADCLFRARVRTIKRDSKHVELPEAGHHSRIDCLLQRIEGCPPYLTQAAKKGRG